MEDDPVLRLWANLTMSDPILTDAQSIALIRDFASEKQQRLDQALLDFEAIRALVNLAGFQRELLNVVANRAILKLQGRL